MNIQKFIISVIIGFMLIGVALGQTNHQGVTDAEGQEILGLIKKFHLIQSSLAYQSAVIQRMLNEANFFAKRLNLPVPYPIQIGDIKDARANPPFYSRIENTNVTSAVERIRSAKIVVGGFVETTNFGFYFRKGQLWNIVRLHHPAMVPEHFQELAARPSLINNSQAYQLTTQWLAAVDVDMAALEKLKWTIHQQRYSPAAATNAVLLPIYYAEIGTKHFHSETTDFDEPLIKVTILGTTKELMELQIGDETLSRRPQMIITNAFELTSIPDPLTKKLQRPPEFQTNALVQP